MYCILVIDVGTSSSRGILYNKKGTALFTKQLPYTPIYSTDKKAEISPAIFTSALISLVTACHTYAAAHSIMICGISITCQRSSLIPVDHYGRPLHNVILWQDQRSLEICEELSSEAERIYEKTGLILSHIPFAPKITWYQRHYPENDHKVHKYLTIVDYLIHIMTGRYVTDYTYGSRTLLMDLRTCQWNDSLLDLFHIKKEKLCSLIPQGTIVGNTTSQFNSLVGFSSSIPVITAGGDQQCSTLGAGCIEHGHTLITTGTDTYVTTTSDSIHIDPSSKIICGISAVCGKYHLESSILAGSTTFNWFLRTFYPDETSYERINYDIFLTKPGSNQILAFPHLLGKASPSWNPYATGVFYGVHPVCTRGDFGRSILEGIAYEIKDNLKLLPSLADPSTSLRIAGGLTNNTTFNQIQADIYGRVTLLKNAETTALGACINGWIAIGMYKDYKEASEAIGSSYPSVTYKPDLLLQPLYCNLYEKRTCLYDKLFQK